MKDKVLICSAVLLCYIIFIFSVKPAVQFASDKFWGFVSQQLSKEEEEKNQKIANDEIVRGKDTVLIWNNKYEIGHYFDGDHLSIKNEDYTFSNVLKNVKRHKVENEKLYIIFDEGLAVKLPFFYQQLCQIRSNYETIITKNPKLLYTNRRRK